MKVTGLITEYNPFHNGHEYHIQKAKEITKSDYIIAIMSGDFVQRGTPACVQKHTRAHMALLSGVDLVIELPLSYATGSAELFANGAVSILNELGVVDSICFGSECGDTDRLMQAAHILTEEPDWYRQKLQSYLKQGLSFPAARAAALPDFSDILDSPNNILGIEYCKALLRLHSPMRPVAIKRSGSPYHLETLPLNSSKEQTISETICSNPETQDYKISLTESKTLPSATALREYIAKCISCDLTSYIPANANQRFQEELIRNGFTHENDFSQMLLFKLLQAKSPDDYLLFEDVSEELAARIFKNRTQFISFAQFADLLKTKEVTRTRINRALLHLLLDVKKDQAHAYYARILGFRKDSATLLSQIKTCTSIPFFSKTSAAGNMMDAEQLQIFKTTIAASQLYEAMLSQKNHRFMIHEHTKPIIIA